MFQKTFSYKATNFSVIIQLEKLCFSLFNVGIVTEPNSGGVSSFIRGLVNESSLRFDPTFSEDLRDFLSAPNFARKLDHFVIFTILFDISIGERQLVT